MSMPVVVEGLIPDSHFRDILYQSKCVHLTLNSHYSPPHQPLNLPPQKKTPSPTQFKDMSEIKLLTKL